MLHIVLIRPGATEYDQQGRIQGSLDIPLSEKGQIEVDRLIEELRPLGLEVIYSSDCRAALESAKRIGKALSIKHKKLTHLRNLDHGLWQGMRIDDVRRKQPTVYRHWQETPASVCPPQGEMLAAAQARADQGVTRLLKKHKQGTVGVVIPEPMARIVMARLEHRELGDLWAAGTEHGTWDMIPVGVPSEVSSS